MVTMKQPKETSSLLPPAGKGTRGNRDYSHTTALEVPTAEVLPSSSNLLYKIIGSPPKHTIIFFAMQNQPKEVSSMLEPAEESTQAKEERRETTAVENGTAEALRPSTNLQYKITDSPPLHTIIFLAMQQIIQCFSGTVILSSVVGDVLCVDAQHPLRSQIFCTALCLAGLNTVAQSLLGCRLPIFQGPSFAFLGPLMALGASPSWTCSSAHSNGGDAIRDIAVNITAGSTVTKLTAHEKLQQLSGSLMAASAVEVLLAALGLVGPILRWVGPLTVGPTVSLIGLSLFRIPIQYSRPSPLMSIGTIVVVVLFALYLRNVQVPCCCGPYKKTAMSPFQTLPVLLSICLTWAVAAILTACGVFTDDPSSPAYKARTDAQMGIVHRTPWLLVTYPGQFGVPSFSLAAFIGFTAAVLSSVVESVGDYHAAAKACEVPPPPPHAVSRGILLEGLGSVLSGVFGAAHATASYSGNIAQISLSRTASRSVLVVAGVLLVATSLFGKIAAAMSTIPEPILGGIALVTLGVLVSIGISTLQHADMQSTRNIIIFGVSLFAGFLIPEYISTYPESINTGNSQVDQVIRVALGTPIFVGGVVACFLDNTVSGTSTERGLDQWTGTDSGVDDTALIVDSSGTATEASRVMQLIYGWSCYPPLLRKWRLLRFVPFLPPDQAT